MKTFALLLLSAVALCAQSLTGVDLVNALRGGGYVIVMRHASSPRETPDDATAKPDNKKKERQLDEIGINSSITMGRAMKNLKIPINSIQSSPTFRALETAKYLDLGSTPEQVPELGDNGQSMAGGTAAQAAWLKKRVIEPPIITNDLVITHMPNITAAFPDIKNVNDGDALVFGKGGQLVGRISITTWPSLVKLGAK